MRKYNISINGNPEKVVTASSRKSAIVKSVRKIKFQDRDLIGFEKKVVIWIERLDDE